MDKIRIFSENVEDVESEIAVIGLYTMTLLIVPVSYKMHNPFTRVPLSKSGQYLQGATLNPTKLLLALSQTVGGLTWSFLCYNVMSYEPAQFGHGPCTHLN